MRLPHQSSASIQNPHAQGDVEVDELKETGSQPGLEVWFVGETVYLMIGSVQSFAKAKGKDKRP